MAWTNPRTWVGGELVTAAVMNVHVRDNLIDLDTRALGVFSADATAVGSPPLTGYQVIKTFTIPALTFDAAGKTVHFQAAGYFAGNANYKVALIRVGGTDFANVSGNINGLHWELDVKVTRMASNSQRIASRATAGGGTSGNLVGGVLQGSTAAADSGPINIDVVSWSEFGTASDIVYLASWAQILG